MDPDDEMAWGRCLGRTGPLIRHLTPGAGLVLAVLLAPVASAQEQPGCGWRPPNPEELAWARQHQVVVDEVRLDHFGLQRLDAERRAVGQAAVDPLAPTVSPAGLPLRVDNSTLRWFPPIGSQGPLGSCASFASTYYTMTYMTARARDWNVASGDQTRIFSTKFTYNLHNGGANVSSSIYATFWIMQDHGVPPLSVLPYNDNPADWPTDAAVWRQAAAFRMGSSYSLQNIHTAAGLTQLKTLLANGIIVNMTTGITVWNFTTLRDDPATPGDDLAGWPVVAWAGFGYNHVMTTVGYDDTVWCDINGNGQVDAGEKGALKVCNSWGPDWGRGGFAYVAYDALLDASAVPGGVSGAERSPAFWVHTVNWIEPRPEPHVPRVLAEVSLDVANRGQLAVGVGLDSSGAVVPSTPWTPIALSGLNGGTLAFRGTAVIDLTDLLQGNQDLRWFLGATSRQAGAACTLQSFRLTDATGTLWAPCVGTNPAGGLPRTVDNATVWAWAEARLADLIGPAAVTDLAATSAGTVITLAWTAPGDDGWKGRADSYDLRWSRQPITEATFAGATPVTGIPVPGRVGTRETINVADVPRGEVRYFALKTADRSGNISPCSNAASAGIAPLLVQTTTTPLPNATAGRPYHVQFTASGGVPPYRWALPGATYTEDASGTAVLPDGGTPLNVRGDSISPFGVEYAFPAGFTFPIGGVATTRVTIFPIGALSFTEADAAIWPYCSSLSTLGVGEDVFATTAPGSLTLRWRAHFWSPPSADGSVNFGVTLFSDGRARLLFGTIAPPTSTPSIGVSAGGRFFPSCRHQVREIPAGATGLFTPIPPLPGFVLDPTSGILSGLAPLPAILNFTVKVTDSDPIRQATNLDYALSVLKPSGRGLILDHSPAITGWTIDPIEGTTWSDAAATHFENLAADHTYILSPVPAGDG